MPGIINSAPNCIKQINGAVPADDSADFVVGAAYEQCAGFMTFGPGTVYGEEGAAAATTYYVLTWVGILFTLAVLVAFVIYERQRLVGHVERLGHWLQGERGTGAREGAAGPAAGAVGPGPDPGLGRLE